MWTLWLTLVGCGPSAAPEAALPAGSDAGAATLRFAGRTLDLAPHLSGFPWSAPLPIPERGALWIDRDGGGKRWMSVPLAGSVDLTKAEPLPGEAGQVDWSTRTRWDARYVPAIGEVLYVGDVDNDEKLNLWAVNPESGALRKLTEETYLYGYTVAPKGDEAVVVARRGEGPYTSCVLRVPLPSGPITTVACDTPAATFTWTAPELTPDGSGVVLRVNKEGRRDRGNLAFVPFDGSAVRLLTDPAAPRTNSAPLPAWRDDRTVLTVSDARGFDEITALNLVSGEESVVWSPEPARIGEINEAKAVVVGGRELLLVVVHRPDADRAVWLDPKFGKILGEQAIDGRAALLGEPTDGAVYAQRDGSATPFVLERWSFEGGFTATPALSLDPVLARRLVQCDVTAVRFPTFDLDPATGAPRELHAFLYTPKQPLKPGVARILSFYGGENAFSAETQVFCEAGIATLSPAVRGTAGFGTAFYTLNDGDLGGDEIADLFAAARYLESVGYERGRIGVYGRSHGGYATMRAMTFPPGTNGHDAPYPFAFGIADAGFSDILSFYADCNIPDWVILEAGDPATEAEKLRDRSPLTHVERLAAPIFLSHGENDSRVPVRESRQFAEACAAAGKSCTYVEFPGQGHRVRGLENEARLYQEKLAFVERSLELGGR